MKKTLVVGTGYVGLVTGTCFSEMGIPVICIDVDNEKIENLKKGILPIYEPGLDVLVEKNTKAGRLDFSTSLEDNLEEAEVIFSAVGTPPDEDGSADLQYVIDVARTIGRSMKDYKLVVTKSTVPVGTAGLVRKTIQAELDKRGLSIPFDVASNPEFLKEGDAVNDFMHPDRVVVGIESSKAEEIMTRLYRPFLLNNFRVIFMDITSAEMTKYAANAMLATRISFMNDIANLCEKVGANINMVRKGIGSDTRIGNKFLYAGCGYGGSCFPKDVKALLKIGEQNDCSMRVIKAVEEVNDDQKFILFHRLKSFYHGDLQGKTIAVWGLAFKPETDDMREAPSLVIINELLNAGCKVKAYDPVAMQEAKRKLGDKITYSKDIYDAVIDADALLVITEWKEFRVPIWNILKQSMKKAVLFDGRNIYDLRELKKEGIEYFGIGI
ncbi:MAG: UDP-glucose/GDP-mannose dehydrogenase family protein [Bacteroidales bacterium]|jgi:UDPglucose 6-dehydrogenase|nr:UDP-glucose/GDP-mannose dehydrogenase family protein [Bacteroidales bacterium]